MKNKLFCPICKSELLSEANFETCTNHKCNIYGYKFYRCDGIPNLIPFGIEDVILNSTDSTNLSNEVNRSHLSQSRYKQFLHRVYRFLICGNPKTRNNLYRSISLLAQKPKILIIGGGLSGDSCEILYKNKSLDITVMDVYRAPMVDFIGDAHYLPIKDETYDFVLVQAVLEHVINPQRVV